MPDAGASASPSLSVLVAAYNAAATIETAVASVLEQRDVDLECVVVDDASTDATPAILAQLAAGDPRLVVERLATNGGVSAARNRALELARGRWLAFLDADDRLLPGGLGTMVRRGEATAALAVVGQRISTDGERTWFPKLYDLPDIREPGRKSLVTHPDLLYYVGPVGKLFHRSTTDGLRFSGRMVGDQPWVVQALVRAEDRIEVVEDLVYEWRRPHPDRYVPTITSERERSARLGAEAVRMAGVAHRVAAGAFAGAHDPATADRLAAHYVGRLLRADLSAQLHRAIERDDPDLPAMLDALAALLRDLPAPAVRANEQHVRVLVIDPLVRRIPALSPAALRSFLRLAGTAWRIDPGLVRSLRGRSRRWPVVMAARVPVVGAALGAAGLRAWGRRTRAA